MQLFFAACQVADPTNWLESVPNIFRICCGPSLICAPKKRKSHPSDSCLTSKSKNSQKSVDRLAKDFHPFLHEQELLEKAGFFGRQTHKNLTLQGMDTYPHQTGSLENHRLKMPFFGGDMLGNPGGYVQLQQGVFSKCFKAFFWYFSRIPSSPAIPIPDLLRLLCAKAGAMAQKTWHTPNPRTLKENILPRHG